MVFLSLTGLMMKSCHQLKDVKVTDDIDSEDEDSDIKSDIMSDSDDE